MENKELLQFTERELYMLSALIRYTEGERETTLDAEMSVLDEKIILNLGIIINNKKNDK
jgi:hypothetical protein